MAYAKDTAKQQFDRWSNSYDRTFIQQLLFIPTHDCLLEQLSVHIAATGRDTRAFLDISCGTGRFLERLRQRFPDQLFVGMDLSNTMLARADERLAGWQMVTDTTCRVTLVQGDSESLPFRTHSFDAVTCANSFHHFPNQERAVREMARVLRPGGHLMIVDGYRDSWWGWFIYDICDTLVEGEVHYASERELYELFGRAGLNDVSRVVGRRLTPFLLACARTPQALINPE